jgi:RNA polymerase sigma-70 factor, ECF subfamily
MATAPSDLIANIFRQEHGKLIAALIGQFGDFELAEDALQDALVDALESWGQPGQTLPNNPPAWLMSAAKRRAIDRVRRRAVAERRQAPLETAQNTSAASDSYTEPAEAEIPDERLKLMFTCCHPALNLEAQVALTLHTLGGLSTAEVARAFLLSLPAMSQRITRARNKIRDAGIPYQVPSAQFLPERLEALLAVIYLIGNEGYSASSGSTLVRAHLLDEAIYLARLLVDLLPSPPNPIGAEPRGLLALLLLHSARRAARTNAEGDLVLLADQDRSLWNNGQIAEGLAMLETAMLLRARGPYQIQAAISALHAEATEASQTDWPQIAQLYGALGQITQSPVVVVNQAVAVGMAYGPNAGMALLQQLRQQVTSIEAYYPYHVAHADFLQKLGQGQAAARAYEKAIQLCPNPVEQNHLRRQILALLPTQSR